MATQDRGLGSPSMDEDKKRAIQSEGGRSQGKENNPGNLANRDEKDRQATARKGGLAHGQNE